MLFKKDQESKSSKREKRRLSFLGFCSLVNLLIGIAALFLLVLVTYIVGISNQFHAGGVGVVLRHARNLGQAAYLLDEAAILFVFMSTLNVLIHLVGVCVSGALTVRRLWHVFSILGTMLYLHHSILIKLLCILWLLFCSWRFFRIGKMDARAEEEEKGDVD